MFVDLSELLDDSEKARDELHIAALIAIAERLDRLCDLIERAQQENGAFKSGMKPL